MYILEKPDSKFKVCTVLRNIMLADQTLNLLVGNRIFPIISIEKAGDGNFIVYQRESYSIQRTKQGIYEQNCTVYITCVASDYDESQEIAEAIYLALEGVRNLQDSETGVTINQVSLIDSTEDFVADKYIQVLKFQID